MELDSIVPFGRSLDEYKRMFALTDADLDGPLIDVGDGPASFNAEMAARGRRIVSVDPIYVLDAGVIEKRFYLVVDDIIGQVKATPDDWVWSYHASLEDLRQNRQIALQRFIADYESGKAEGRYVTGELPRLDFPDQRFRLALCSHFLFLYSDHLDYEFHRASVFEMLRVAREVRIFPLLTLRHEISPCLQPLIDELESAGFYTSTEAVDYELQRGGTHMLRILPAA